MSYWKVILATIVIFGTGVITGGLLVRHTQQLAVPVAVAPALTNSHPSLPGAAVGLRREFLRRAERELDLTPQQRAQIDAVMKESQERTRKLMEPVNPQIRAEIERSKEAFLTLLTPEQRARFEAMVKQQRKEKGPRHSPSHLLSSNQPPLAR